MASPLRILVADSDEKRRGLLQAGLCLAGGHTTVPVGNDRLVLEELAVDPTYDLVVVNSGIPDMQGSEILRYMREGERTSRIPMVLLMDAPDPLLQQVGKVLDAICLPRDISCRELLAEVEKFTASRTG